MERWVVKFANFCSIKSAWHTRKIDTQGVQGVNS